MESTGSGHDRSSIERHDHIGLIRKPLPFSFTLLTIQRLSYVLLPTGFGEDPGSGRHRRTVPHMLPMPARQIRNPITVFILMVSNNRLLHVYQHTNE
jgi:hypothetical protein